MWLTAIDGYVDDLPSSVYHFFSVFTGRLVDKHSMNHVRIFVHLLSFVHMLTLPVCLCARVWRLGLKSYSTAQRVAHALMMVCEAINHQLFCVADDSAVCRKRRWRACATSKDECLLANLHQEFEIYFFLYSLVMITDIWFMWRFSIHLYIDVLHLLCPLLFNSDREKAHISFWQDIRVDVCYTWALPSQCSSKWTA